MTPIKLIDCLKIELQQFGEIITDIFPGRVKLSSDREYSKIWGIKVNKLKTGIRKGASLSNKSVRNLRKKIEVKEKKL